MGLGGAFTAIANDASGLFYNPAGMVDSTSASISISASLYGLDINVGGNLFSDVGSTVLDFDRIATDLTIIPTSAGYVDSFGEKDEQGRPRHAYSLGVFVPSYTSQNVQSTGPTSEGMRGAYRRNLLDRTIFAGAAYAYRIDETLSFGIAGLFAYRSLRDQEESSVFSATDDPAMTAFRSGQTNLEVSTGALLFTAGFKAQLSPRWVLGASVTTPTAPVYSLASLRVIRSTGDPLGLKTSTYSLNEANGLEADFGQGTSVRFGAAYIVPHRATFSLDVSFHAPVHYQLVNLETAPPAVAEAVSVVTDIRRLPVINVNAGYELLLVKDFSIAVGAFSDFSSAPAIPKTPEGLHARDYLPNVQGAGGTLVLGFFTEHTLTRGGLVVNFSQGTDVIPTNAQDKAAGGSEDFRSVDVKRIFAYVFITSAFRY